MDGLFLYIKESYNELINKVTWPSWSDLISNSNIVVIATIIITLLVLVMDLASTTILDVLYPATN